MWNLLAQSSGDEAAGIMALVGGTMFNCVFSIALYVVAGLALSTIAKKTGNPNTVWAWIPILNALLLLQIADLEWWWLIIGIVTCGLAFIWPWMKVAEKRGKPSWIGILIIVPCIGFFVPLYIAYSD